MVARRPFRKTRNSVVPGDLTAPYHVELGSTMLDGLIHSIGFAEGGIDWVTCCRSFRAGLVRLDARVPTCLACLACAMCMGCWTCKPNYIVEETMMMGKWETKDGRTLYPFEMDNEHLVNAIAKLKRDKSHFKDDWQAWVRVLTHETKLRRLR